MARSCFLVLAAFVPSIAAAQPADVPKEPSPGLMIGAQLAVVPYSRWYDSYSGDAAYGIEGLLEDRLSSLVAIGLSPRLLLHESAGYPGSTSGELYELRARLTIGGYLSRSLHVAGIVFGGYSWLDISDSSSPQGVVAGGGIAARVHRDRWRLTAELTYEKGFQLTSGVIDSHVDQLAIALGFARALSTRPALTETLLETTRVLWAGARFDVVPYSRWTPGGRGRVGEGFAAIGDYRITDLLAIGVAPRLVLHTTPSAFNSDQNRLYKGYVVDIPARVMAGGNVSRDVRVQAIAQLGYSIIEHVYADTNNAFYRSRGLIFGAGVGAAFYDGSRIRIDTEIVYQFGPVDSSTDDRPWCADRSSLRQNCHRFTSAARSPAAG